MESGLHHKAPAMQHASQFHEHRCCVRGKGHDKKSDTEGASFVDGAGPVNGEYMASIIQGKKQIDCISAMTQTPLSWKKQ